ncbi:type II toxin-antitoxin system antitoxin SocA domain-containing protein [Mesorhizobium sp. M0618]|uniref:Panacea domain-containing protein n=1 Tax=unclassified Mesorhizobium TaxID=325217 RepID=UPI0033370614
MSTLKAAKTIWDLLDGKVSNLKLQKLLYLAHMFELAKGNGPLAGREFEAWDYGPVEPDLYHKLKAYGGGAVPDIFYSEPYVEGTSELDSIRQVVNQVGRASPARLVAITHWNGGAWSKNYVPDARRIRIPDEDIIEEYKAIAARNAQKRGTAAA